MAGKPRLARVSPKRTRISGSRAPRVRRPPKAAPPPRRRRWPRRILGSFAVLFAAAAIFALYLYVGVIPREDIARLKDGYVAVSYENGRVRYSPVDAMPKDWAPLNSLSETTARAFILAEDARFYRHHGIDLREIWNAVTDAARQGKRPRGAGTITQQVARNLFLSQHYSYWRKIKESVIALYMERTLTKARILEIYLNAIEYGEGLYGITAASRHYFGKAPAQLAPREAAFLATLLPSPVRYSRDLRRQGLTEPARAKVDKILEAMRWLDYLSADQYRRETAAPLRFTPQALGAG